MTDREEFERWYASAFGGVADVFKNLRVGNEYPQESMEAVNTAWAAWQAARTGGEVEPVAWVNFDGSKDSMDWHVTEDKLWMESYPRNYVPLYTAPPAVVPEEVTESDAPAFLWGESDRHHWALGYNECIADHFTTDPQPPEAD